MPKIEKIETLTLTKFIGVGQLVSRRNVSITFHVADALLSASIQQFDLVSQLDKHFFGVKFNASSKKQVQELLENEHNVEVTLNSDETRLLYNAAQMH